MRRLLFLATACLVASGLTAMPAQADEPTAPLSPTSVTAKAGVNQAKVAWAPPVSDGGSPITGYTVTSGPGEKTCTTSGALTCNVTGLSNGATYTFTVTATNAIGASAPGGPSNTVTPNADTTNPVLVSSKVTPSRVSSLGGTVTVELRIADDLSGIRTPSGGLDANPAILFSRDGSSSVGFTRGMRRVSGDEYDGIYRTTTTIPAGTAAGSWGLTVYPIGDNAGNRTSFIDRPGLLVGSPAAPTDVAATAFADRHVTVHWTPPTDDGGNVITGYRITENTSGAVYTVDGSTTSLTRSFAELRDDVPLTFTVQAVNVAGLGEASSPSESITVPAIAPSAPTVTSVQPANKSVAIAWAAPADDGGSNISGYTVTDQLGEPACSTSGALTCAATGLDNGTAYTFTVVATNSAGDSAPSALSAPAIPFTVPGAPGDVTATAGDHTAMVSWGAAAAAGTPVTGYRVTATPSGKTITVPANQLSANVTGLTNGIDYTFTVAATSKAGTGQESTASNAVTPLGAPLAVSTLSVEAGDRQTQVTWGHADANGSALVSYTITTIPGNISVTVPPTRPTVVDGLTNGTRYRFVVRATNGVGAGQASTSTAVTPYGLPGAVSGVRATTADRAARLTWNPAPSNGAVVRYRVVTSPGAKAVTVTGTSARVTQLKNGTTYRFQVQAVNAAGAGPLSATSNKVIPAGPPGVVTKPRVRPGNRSVTVTWSPAAANGARITKYAVTSSTGKTMTVNGSVRSVRFTRLKQGKTYTFRVRRITRPE